MVLQNKKQQILFYFILFFIHFPLHSSRGGVLPCNPSNIGHRLPYLSPPCCLPMHRRPRSRLRLADAPALPCEGRSLPRHPNE
jgi:hypothetical protein